MTEEDQEYVDAPAPVRITSAPSQTGLTLAFAVIVGSLFKTTVTVEDAVHPLESVPVTV